MAVISTPKKRRKRAIKQRKNQKNKSQGQHRRRRRHRRRRQLKKKNNTKSKLRKTSMTSFQSITKKIKHNMSKEKRKSIDGALQKARKNCKSK